MKIKSLNCPRCGAVLEAENGLDTFFCMYCGNKIILSGQSDIAYREKGKILEYQNEEKKWSRDETSKDNELDRKFKDDIRRCIAGIVFFVIFMLLLEIMKYL